jgi:hypothetical protein
VSDDLCGLLDRAGRGGYGGFKSRGARYVVLPMWGLDSALLFTTSATHTQCQFGASTAALNDKISQPCSLLPLPNQRYIPINWVSVRRQVGRAVVISTSNQILLISSSCVVRLTTESQKSLASTEMERQASILARTLACHALLIKVPYDGMAARGIARPLSDLTRLAPGPFSSCRSGTRPALESTAFHQQGCY